MEPIRLAVTVDDLFLWKKAWWAPGFSPAVVTQALIEALSRHDIKGVYLFFARRHALQIPRFSSFLTPGSRLGTSSPTIRITMRA
jgi:hypothetical protein